MAMAGTRTAPPPPAAEIDTGRALDLVMQMMAIPGRSGEEGRVAEFIVGTLRGAGVPAAAIETDDVHRRSPRGGEIGNLVVRLPGTHRGPRRLLMAHMDTVPICVGSKPTVVGDNVRSGNGNTGLGADNRSGCSVLLHAATEIVRRGLLHPPLTFLWTVQEEVGLYGARFIRAGRLGNPKLCFNWDGDSPAMVTVGATGAYRMHIRVDGKASHAGVAPEKGVSAIAAAGLAIAEIQQAGWHGLIVRGKQRGTSNLGPIAGGEATNVVAGQVTLHAEARSHDPKFRRQIVAAYRRAFQNAAKAVRAEDGTTARIHFDQDLHYESFRLDPNERVVQVASNVIRHLGMEPFLKVSNGGLDANWLSARGLPTVTLGAGQRDVHTVAESLHIPSFWQGCRVACALATGA